MILNDVIAALDVLFTAAVDVPVFDVPDPSVINNDRFIVIGSEGEDDDGATVDLTESTLGPGGWLDETGEVVCSVWAASGGTDLAARRNAAATLTEACVAAVRNDRELGGLLVGAGVAGVSSLRYRLVQTPQGAFCRFSFSVSYQNLNT
jgi:hypothetical protein